MKSKTRNGVLLVAAAVIMALNGCATTNKVKDWSHDATTKSEEAEKLPANQGDVIIHHEQAFLIGDMVDVAAPLPAFLMAPIIYHSVVSVPFSTISSYVSSETGVPVEIGALSSNSAGLGSVLGGSYPKVTVNYTGPLAGLLDTLANETGAYWRYSEGKISFYRTITKTFWLETMLHKSADTSTLSSVSGDSGDSSGGGGGGGGSSGSSGGSSGSQGGNASGGISAKNTYADDPWAGIEKTAKVVGETAQIAVDSSTGSITVTGSPSDVTRVGQWVEGLNHYYGQQIEVEMHVYSVTLNSEDNYSISPDIIYTAAGGINGYALKSVSAPTIQGQATAGAFTLTKTNVGTNTTPLNGTNAAVAALSTMGRVVQTYSQSQVTANGHPTVMQTGNSISYLYSVSNNTTANVGSSTTLTPGIINTGLTTLVLPKIAGGTINLDVTLSNANLTSITSVSSGGSTIQTPTVNSTNLQQDVILHPGDALLLTSQRGENGSSTNQGTGSPLTPILGGGLDATASKTMIAVVITAKIL